MATHHRNFSSGAHLKKSGPSHGKGLKPAPQQSKKGVSHKGGRSSQNKDESDEEMAASFLPYCTMCEKQIITPSNSVLYCSESCKRKDRDKKPSYGGDQYSPPQTPFSKTFSYEDLPTAPDIVPQRSPTSANLTNNRYSYSSFSEDDRQVSEAERRPTLTREDSEASRYLRQFHFTNGMTAIDESKPSRPRLHRAAMSQAAISIAPSLSHTPGSYMTSGMSIPYTPHSLNAISYSSNTNPLPSRHHPHSAASYGAKSIELVTPISMIPMTAPEPYVQPLPGLKTSPSTATISHGWVEGEMMRYEKKSLDLIRERAASATASPSRGSLKQLFAFEEMRAPPSSSGFRS